MGTLGYPVDVGSLWHYDSTNETGFVYFGGFWLGLGAGILLPGTVWIQTSYPIESRKMLYSSIQQFMPAFSLTVGALITFGIVNGNQTTGGVSSAVYATFIVITALPTFTGLLFITDPKELRRSYGSGIALFESGTVWGELKGIAELFKDIKPSINAHYFNVRTRAFNNIIVWSVQWITAAAMQPILDSKRLSRRTRGFSVCIFLTCLVVGDWVGELVWLQAHQAPRLSDGPGWGWTDADFTSFIVIYLFQGMLHQLYWIFIQWAVDALSNPPHLLARCSGLLKACLAGGTCIAFGVDSVLPPFEYEVARNFGLQGCAMCILVYICGFKSTATSYGKEDDVIIPSSEDATIEAASEDVAVIPSLKETVASKQERARKFRDG
ncbi:hypothetical protein NCS57_01450700 [Fusarium keratoplasticum]|uniref:Uncharacterized protein n=1 Tax=Fusarium keratoplasticum TaxID=1328300 RepID=A0ACC0QB59_9HYPO|nr:hypothetical protein NCS57_01450700 [Fusarium keratoplasticum]KAI8649146.1 hypothetical protein NCS57_01450700 [Fusarium keratoplasticum]